MTRSEASRANGAQSPGPVTPEGKARASRNALKHGLTSAQIVIDGESQEEFDALLSDFRKRYQPVGSLEKQIVVDLAAVCWRLRRIPTIESHLFNEQMARQLADEENPVAPEDVFAKASSTLFAGTALARLHRYEAQLRRAEKRCVEQLAVLQKYREQFGWRESRKPQPETDERNDAITREVLTEMLNETNPNVNREGFLSACITTLHRMEGAAASTQAARAA